MKRILVVMWITIVVLIGLTLWLLFNPSAFLRSFQYVPLSELEKARADAQATRMANQSQADRWQAESQRQNQTLREHANKMAIEKMEVIQAVEQRNESASQSRRQLLAILLSALAHDEPAVRAWGAKAVGDLDEPLKEAIPRLTELLQDQNEQAREAAQKTLTILTPASKEIP